MPISLREKLRVASVYLITALTAFLLFRFLFPFCLAFFTAFLLTAIANTVSDKTTLSKKALRLFSLAVLLLVIAALATLAIRAVVRESEGFLSALYEWARSLLDTLLRLLERLKSRFHLDGTLPEEKITQTLTALFTRLASTLSARLATFAAEGVKKLPRLLIASLTYLLATFYLALDYERSLDGIKKLIPKKAVPFLQKIKTEALSLLRHIAKAYGILFLITFGIVALWFFLFGIDYPIWWALLAALLDTLPAIGVGIVLIPWAIGLFTSGKTVLGILFLCLYLGVTLLRQALEPRILGRELGVPPLVSLASLYLGFRLFGGWGILFSPLLSVVATRIFKRKVSYKG